MRAHEIMTRNPVTVSPDVSIRAAAALLAEHRIASMPVVDDGRVIGIVSELDLIRNRMPHDPRSTALRREDGPDPARTVREVMTDVVVCMPDSTDLADLARTFVDDRIRAVPIVSTTGLVGIVSRRDVLRTLLRDDTGIASEARHRLSDYDPETAWRVSVADGVITATAHALSERDERAADALLRTIPGAVRVHIRSKRFAH